MLLPKGQHRRRPSGTSNVVVASLLLLTAFILLVARLWILSIVVFYVALLITATYPAARRKWLIHQRVFTGRCPSCGYDLRGNLDACSECGTRIPPWRRKRHA